MTTSLQQLIASAKASARPLIVPGVYDAISARAARELNFSAVYIGSYATGATRYGVPDIGYIGAEDMADQVRRIAALVDVPIIVDAEGGFGNPLHVARTVALLERSGASALHIEDHDFGKHITPTPRVLSLQLSVDKIKAAVDAKRSADFMVVARTDSVGSLGGDAAIERAIAFQEAGADGVFIAGRLDEAGWAIVRREITVPVFGIDHPGKSAQDSGKQGVHVLMYYGLTHFAALQGIRAALQELATKGSTVALEASLPSMADFDAFLGIGKAREDAGRFGLLD
ncbi:MAG: isocitrate lyase/PEP mutase family protein [Janthinobacterium lividum]